LDEMFSVLVRTHFQKQKRKGEGEVKFIFLAGTGYRL